MDELIKLDQVDEITVDLAPVNEISIDFGDMVAIVKPPELESLVVTPTKEQQVFTPSKFGTYFDKATIKPIPQEFANISDTTATSKDVASGKVFYDANGNRTEGVGDVSTITESNISQIKAINIASNYPSISDEDYVIAEQKFQVLAKEILGLGV